MMNPGIPASSKPSESSQGHSVWLGVIAAQWMDDHHSDEWMGAEAFDHFKHAVQAGWAGWGGTPQQALDWLTALQDTLNQGYLTHIDLVSDWTQSMASKGAQQAAAVMVDAVMDGCSNEWEFAKAAGAVADAMRGSLVAFSPDGLKSFEGLFRASMATRDDGARAVSSAAKRRAP